MAKSKVLNVGEAEALALQVLTFLAEDAERLVRFMSLTGTTPQSLKANAGEPHMLAAVLGYLLEDEPLLLVFTSMKELDPASIEPAHALLQRAAAAHG